MADRNRVSHMRRRHLSSQLVEMQRVVELMLEQEFIATLVADLRAAASVLRPQGLDGGGGQREGQGDERRAWMWWSCSGSGTSGSHYSSTWGVSVRRLPSQIGLFHYFLCVRLC